MSDTIEGIRGALGLIFAGFILLVFVQTITETAIDTGMINLNLVGILAILGGVLVLLTAIVVAIANVLT